MSSNNKNNKKNNISNITNSTESIEERVIINTSAKKKLISGDSNTEKSLDKNRKVKVFHLKFLKKYLEEDKFIGPTEARDRLQKETDLKISVPSIFTYLKNLRKEMGPEYADLDPSIVKNRQMGDRIRFKDSHLDRIKSYLIEDNYIGPREAKNKLQEETSLEISISTIRKFMRKLRKEMDLEIVNLNQSTYKSRRIKTQTKIKDSHLECLKNYLKEDITIGPAKAKKLLQEETGLNVTASTVRNAMIKLKKVMDPEYANSDIPKVKSIQHVDRTKFKDSHLDRIKSYLIEDNYIGPREVKNRLQKDTALKISFSYIQKITTSLRKEMDLELVNLNQSTVKSRQCKDQAKIKDSHLELLKQYLKDDRFIGPAKAKILLQEQTGLIVTAPAVQNAITKLRKELGPEYDSLDPSMVKTRRSEDRFKMKYSHLEHLQKYLKQNSNIGSTEARNRLKNDTGLEVSITTVRKYLINTKREMPPQVL